MDENTIKFGTDGWRALMEKDFTFGNVERVAQAFGDYLHVDFKSRSLKRRPKAVIGFDYRKDSENFARRFAEVLVANDVDVILSEAACPTPAVSFTIVDRKYDAGIVVTASHNPPAYNGIKIKTDFGGSADQAITGAVENLIGKHEIRKAAPSGVRLRTENFNLRYLDFLKRYVRLDVIGKSPFRILVDSMHGVGDRHIENMLQNGKVKVTTVRSDRDVTFGGVSPEPIPQNIADTIARMQRREFDLAVITDGDADRIGAVRPGGEFVTPGVILSLIMIHFVQDLKRRGSVVTTISNTSLIYKVARKLGLPVHETPVGFKYICEIMRRENVLIGGEESGGIGFQDYLYERDGMLSALLLMEMMAMRNQTFEEILSGVEKEYGKLFYVRNDLKYPNDLKPRLFPHLKANLPKALQGQPVREVKDQDGMKLILQDESWLLFRLSGTEPILRIYSEATSQPLAERLVQDGKVLAFNV